MSILIALLTTLMTVSSPAITATAAAGAARMAAVAGVAGAAPPGVTATVVRRRAANRPSARAPATPVAPVGPVGPVAPAAHGVWPLPAPHPIVRGFSPPSSLWGAGHRGVDLGGHVGEPVRAALAGRITFAAVLAGRGVVVVDHGRTRTTYEPVAASVTVGDVVAAGQRIGTLTRTLSHCLPRACLHWGYLRGRTYLDPLVLVGGGPIRLLPMSAP